MLRKILLLMSLSVILLSGCERKQSPPAQVTAPPTAVNSPLPPTQPPTAVVPTAVPTTVPTLTPTITASPMPLVLGPDTYSPGINPLTGLMVADPDTLKLPPAFISTSFFPLSARPPAGISYSPIVFEFSIGEGMSRFLAGYYGDLPGAGASVGPIRSGRLFYEPLRSLYNGFLVMASATPSIAANLNAYTTIFGSDAGDVSSAFIPVAQLEQIARDQKPLTGESPLHGMLFDAVPPAGGAAGDRLFYFYAMLNQTYWQYDPAAGGYHRFQDNSDGLTFTEMTDRLTGEPLTYENVVVLLANHRYCTETVFEVDLLGIPRSPALLFRDGRVYKIYWTTWGDEYEQTTGKLRPIRFMDENGKPFPFKPGQTWIYLTPLNTPAWESVDSTVMFDVLNKLSPGSGKWVVRFFPEMMVEDLGVCEKVGY